MDRAYEGDETRQLAFELGYFPVVPPKSRRINPRSYDEAMYRRCNEIERLSADSRASVASSQGSRSSM
jgi:hypothetical protein